MTIPRKKRKPRHTKGNGKWYSEGLRFSCRKCGACCGGAPGFVRVTEHEIKKIARHLGIGPDEFTSRFIRRAGSGYSLTELRNGDCVFLENGTCRIYPVRPLQCTTWPFWDVNLTSRKVWEECSRACPGASQGRRHTFSEIQKTLLKHKRDT